MQLSIIVPVYNVEKYLDGCLQSIFFQDYSFDSFEVIVVNDGTKDNSMDIVNEYRKYPNLVVIEQENAGLSAARNAGLKAAKGDYVWFIDSDDTIEPDSIKNLLALTSKFKVEMLCFGVNKIDEATGEKSIIPFAKRSQKLIGKVLAGKECLKEIGVTGCSVRFLFKRNFLLENNLLFHIGVYHEDMEHSVKALFFAKSVYLADLFLYNYLIRTTGSIMTSFNMKKSKDCLEIVNELVSFKCHNSKNIKDKLILNGGALFMMICSLMQLKQCYKDNKVEIDQFISNNRIFYLKHFSLVFHWKLNVWAAFWGTMIVVCPKLLLKE